MRKAIAADYSGQDVYVGIDSHRKHWSVCIATTEKIHKAFSQDPLPETLLRYLHRHYPGGDYHLAYEAGFAGNWIAREFIGKGIDCIIVNPADIPTNDKERRRKTDARDCAKIARTHRSGELEPLYVPQQQAEDDRQLVRARSALVRKQTRTKNQIKSLLATSGISLPSRAELPHWSGGFISWLEQQFDDRPSLKQALDVYLDELRWQRTRLAALLRQLRVLAQTERYAVNVRLLLSVPGVGLVIAMVLLTELIDIKRFRSLSELCSYVGLVPDTAGSGDSEHTVGISHRGNQTLRAILIESAWVAIRQDAALGAKMALDQQRMPKNQAIIRATRKLLARIHHVLRVQEPYRFDVTTVGPTPTEAPATEAPATEAPATEAPAS